MREPRKELSSEDRGRIVGAYLCGTAPSTVYKTVNRYKQSGSAHPKGRPGRPKSLNDREQRVVKRVVLAGAWDHWSPLDPERLRVTHSVSYLKQVDEQCPGVIFQENNCSGCIAAHPQNEVRRGGSNVCFVCGR